MALEAASEPVETPNKPNYLVIKIKIAPLLLLKFLITPYKLCHEPYLTPIRCVPFRRLRSRSQRASLPIKERAAEDRTAESDDPETRPTKEANAAFCGRTQTASVDNAEPSEWSGNRLSPARDSKRFWNFLFGASNEILCRCKTIFFFLQKETATKIEVLLPKKEWKTRA